MLLSEQLRSLVNQHGIFAVLDALSGLCGQEAERAKNFDSKDNWLSAETAIDAAASKVLDTRLS